MQKETDLRKYGFIRVAVATPLLSVANCDYNVEQMQEIILQANEKKVDVVVFPELGMTGYTASDLFQQELLQDECFEGLYKLLNVKSGFVVTTIGMPIALDNQLFNCAVLLQFGKILGIVPKTYIPGNKEYQEKRWFSSARNAISSEIEILGQKVPFGTDLLFEARNFKKLVIGAEICEDLWAPIPPSSYQAIAGATLLLNLSASNELVGKAEYRRLLVQQQSARCIACYAYSSAGTDESTTDVVFSGHAIIADNGEIVAESEQFSRENQLNVCDIDIKKMLFYRQQTTSFGDSVFELKKKFRKIEFDLTGRPESELKMRVNPLPFVPEDPSKRDERCEEIFSIQVAGLLKRLESGNIKKTLIGISGGLDSTLALLVSVQTFDLLGFPRQDILALSMPGFGTSGRTKENGSKLCEALDVGFKVIDIQPSCLQEFKDIGHDANEQNLVFENVQARMRTKLLFDSGNQVKGLVLGTGDLSEIALGFCTYAGDHMSHYNVNATIPKTLVKYLIRWVAETQADGEAKKILLDILDTPISPELISIEGETKFQKTEEIIGPYELHDFFLHYFVRWGMSPSKILFLAENAFKEKYSREEIRKWLKIFIEKFFANQWKRSCMPDGPKVGSVSLSPRADWRMASDADAVLWVKNLKEEGVN